MHSDHNPLLVLCHSPRTFQGERPFRFIAAWTDHKEYRGIVGNAWRNSGGYVHRKLARVQSDSLSFNKHTFGNIFQRKRHIEGRLKGVQRELDHLVRPSLVMLENQLQEEYRQVLRQEEGLWFQKSREQWVKFGDRNTTFFHTQTVMWRDRKSVV